MHDFFSIPLKLSSEVNFFLLIIAAVVMIVTCFRLIISKNLLESIVIMSIFSLLISICYLFMDAPDVAMTEVALGACLSTCVLLNLVKIFGEDVGGNVSKSRFILAIILCVLFVGLLIYASLDLPLYGDANTPVQTYLTKYYIANTAGDTGVTSMVAAILASYRGYDTLGETSVILVAGLAVVLILARRKE
jgi:multicomponent Na+:H+ antiporter subunit B